VLLCVAMSMLVLSGVPESIIDGLKSAGVRVVMPYTKIFPDGEQYIRIEEEVDSCIVLQSMYPEQDRRFIELYLALEALRGLNAKCIGVIVLYLAYARQDKRFLRGEPISIYALMQPLKLLGIDRVGVIDVHSESSLRNLGLEVLNVLPHKYMIEKSGIKVEFVLAPDKGALARAKAAAEGLGIPYDNLEKFRDRITGEITMKEKRLDVAGKTVAIVDDIVSTGGTLAKAIENLYKLGASKVYAVVSHALLVGNAIEKLERSGIEELITLNTVRHRELPKWVRVVDCTELVLDIAKELGYRSV